MLYLANSSRPAVTVSCWCDCVEVSEGKSGKRDSWYSPMWASILMDSEKISRLESTSKVPLNYQRTPEGRISSYRKQDQNRRRRARLPLWQRDRWTKRPKRAASKRKLCGHHAGTCHASLVQNEEVKLATTEETKSSGEDGCPRADQRRVDSPRLLFSLMLFSCSCSNRTVNNNNNSREKRWLTGSPDRASWLVKDVFWPGHWLLC